MMTIMIMMMMMVNVCRTRYVDKCLFTGYIHASFVFTDYLISGKANNY